MVNAPAKYDEAPGSADQVAFQCCLGRLELRISVADSFATCLLSSNGFGEFAHELDGFASDNRVACGREVGWLKLRPVVRFAALHQGRAATKKLQEERSLPE